MKADMKENDDRPAENETADYAPGGAADGAENRSAAETVDEAPADGQPEKPEEETLSPLKAFTETESVEEGTNVSLREILGGDILTADWLRRQMGLIVLCVFFAIIYITNRYSAEQELIEIERLKTELTEVKYRALTRSSELTVKTRQSQVEQSLRTTPDSVLQAPKAPPFLIKKPKVEEE